MKFDLNNYCNSKLLLFFDKTGFIAVSIAFVCRWGCGCGGGGGLKAPSRIQGRCYELVLRALAAFVLRRARETIDSEVKVVERT